jgi:ATP-dependent DNA ligase
MLRSIRGLPIALAQPTPAHKPPTGPDWLHEIKFDGYRLLAQRELIGGRLLTRNGYDWSSVILPYSRRSWR